MNKTVPFELALTRTEAQRAALAEKILDKLRYGKTKIVVTLECRRDVLLFSRSLAAALHARYENYQILMYKSHCSITSTELLGTSATVYYYALTEHRDVLRQPIDCLFSCVRYEAVPAEFADKRAYEVLFADPDRCALASLSPRCRFATRSAAEQWASSTKPSQGTYFAIAAGTVDEIDALPEMKPVAPLLKPVAPGIFTLANPVDGAYAIGSQPLVFAAAADAARTAAFITRYCAFRQLVRGSVVVDGTVMPDTDILVIRKEVKVL